MTIATGRGFEIGKLYRATEKSTGSYYVEGTILKFTEDDDSHCPWFEYVGGPCGGNMKSVGQRVVVDLDEVIPTDTPKTTSKDLLILYVQQHHALDKVLNTLVNSL